MIPPFSKDSTEDEDWLCILGSATSQCGKDRYFDLSSNLGLFIMNWLVGG